MSWAWDQDLPAPEKVVLLAIADQARGDGVLIHGPQAELAAMTGAAVRTVRSNLAKLEERGLIRRWPQFEERVRVPDLIMVAVDGSLALPADLAGGRNGRALQSSKPPQTEKKKDVPGEIGRWHEGVPEELRADVEAQLQRKLKADGRLITAEEMATAAAALAEFNRQAGAEFGLGAHVKSIAMRIRERPSYDAEAHVRLVQSAWRLKWWERMGNGKRPTPAVIYGNERVFEQVVQDATDEKNGVERAAQPGRFTRTKGHEEDL